MATRENFTTPVGRLVAGSLVKGNDKDAEGRPLVVKNGPQAGQPRLDFFFALAIAKGAEAMHGPLGWMVTPWGATIRRVGESFLAHAASLPTFAWKVRDGDSTVPNKRGKVPRDQEGWAGHWVLMFSSGYPPKTYSLVGSTTPNACEATGINLGDYVQVNGDCGANGSASQPGVYLNHNMVCLVGYGQHIVVGPDVASAGFGGQPLPAGASMTPPGGFTPPQVPGAMAVPPAGVPAVPGAVVPPVAVPSLPAPGYPSAPPLVAPGLPPTTAPSPAVAAVPGNPVAYAPNLSFLQVPGAPIPAAVPQVPQAPAAPVRRLTAAANGASYEQLIAAGWTDQMLVAQGLMVA